MTVIAVPAVDGIRRAEQPVRLAYRDVSAAAALPGTPLVLLHGSPGTSDVFRGLAITLGSTRRLVIPDLPGFGGSTASIPDYSIRAHARYVLDLLDKLDVPLAHVLAFSMGGGVALEMAALEPSRVASIVLVSAIGVQEMELLGHYHLNHAAHAIQAGAAWALRNLVPHGGSFDSSWSFARNFYDSDQRPLRGHLTGFGGPMLIVHGRRDPLVPVEAAREHARLVPQAELVVLDADHFMTFQDPARLPPVVQPFLDRVEGGSGTTRVSASADRVHAAAKPFDARTVPRARAVNAAVLSAIVAIASAALGGWAHVGAGVLVAQGRASLAMATVAVLAGTFAVRRYSTRNLVSAVGAVALGALSAPRLLDQLTGWSAWPRLLLVSAIVAGAAWALTTAGTYRRRRLIVSSWRRLTRWEFWPLLAAYVPVAGYVAWLMVKHRSVTVFTAANPAIPGGGVVGESKIAILRGLDAARAYVAASALIEGGLTFGAKAERAQAFIQARGLNLPVVLKPDAGQRGSGVVVARTAETLSAALASAHVDTVIQEYVGGEEFGVFYCRRPSEPRGRIISITRKELPAVRGDGVRTLERLILDDERAVCMARFHLRRQRARLRVVPAAGAVVPLGDCGSHCRGAAFHDGGALKSDALETAIDGVAGAFGGFYFGRFDLRVPSAAALAEGRDFKILELNGVTSEPTHIYDSAVPLSQAYRALFEQWRLAFEIGAENVARGARAASVRDLVELAWRYRRDARHHLSAASVEAGDPGDSRRR